MNLLNSSERNRSHYNNCCCYKWSPLIPLIDPVDFWDTVLIWILHILSVSSLLCWFFTAVSSSENRRWCLVVVEDKMKRARLEWVSRNKGSSQTSDFVVKLGLHCEGLCLSGIKGGEKEEGGKKKNKSHSSCSLISLPLFAAKLLKWVLYTETYVIGY